MLCDQINQSLIFRQAQQISKDWLIEPHRLADVDLITQQPGQQRLHEVFAIMHVVAKKRIVDAIKDIHIDHDLLNCIGNPGDIGQMAREKTSEHGCIILQAFTRTQPGPLIGDADGYCISGAIKLNTQAFQHGNQDARVFKSPDTRIKGKALMPEGVDQAAGLG